MTTRAFLLNPHFSNTMSPPFSLKVEGERLLSWMDDFSWGLHQNVSFISSKLKTTFYWLSVYTMLLLSPAQCFCKHILLMNLVSTGANTSSPCMRPVYCETLAGIISLCTAQNTTESKTHLLQQSEGSLAVQMLSTETEANSDWEEISKSE